MEDSIHDELLQWIKSNILNETLGTISLLTMIDSPHEGHTYCLQSQVKDDTALEELRETTTGLLLQTIAEKFREKAFVFDSTMQYLKD